MRSTILAVILLAVTVGAFAVPWYPGITSRVIAQTFTYNYQTQSQTLRSQKDYTLPSPVSLSALVQHSGTKLRRRWEEMRRPRPLLEHLLLGIALVGFTWVFSPSPLCLLHNYPCVSFPPTTFDFALWGQFLYGVFGCIFGTAAGLILIISAFKSVPYCNDLTSIW